VVNGTTLFAIAADGKVIAKTAFGGAGLSSPTLGADGTLYIASRTGQITAFATHHGGLMKSPWPKFQHDISNSGRAQ
jgi:outer membrane protein assembly factor BamB